MCIVQTLWHIKMVFLYLALFCLVLLFLWRKREHKLGFPGPSGFPFIGCFFSMRGKPMHDLLYDWSLQYGGAFTFSVFGKQILVVSNQSTLHEVLVSRGKAYAGRTRSYQMEVYSDNYRDIIFTSNLAHSSILRKAVHGSIKAYGTGRTKLAAILDTATADLVDGFQKTSAEAVDPKEMLYRVTVLTMCLLISGQRFDDDEQQDLPRIVEEFDHSGNHILEPSMGNVLLDVLPFLRGKPWFQAGRNIKQFFQNKAKLFECLLEPALEKSKESSELTVGRGLLNIVGQKYGEGNKAGEVTMDNVKLACMNLIAAGTFTTSMTLYALLNLLQWNPDIQERIYQEVMREVGDGRAVLLEDRDKMPYSRAVVLEALRYVTLIPIGHHVTLEDTSLSGIPVPKGTQVLLNLWACHHDPRLWSDPWTFKPERFLDEGGQLLLPDHPNRKQLFPFGAGIRNCVGEVLATNRLFLFTTNCVQRFRFTPPDGADPTSCDARKYPSGIAIEPTVFQTKACVR